MHVIWQLIFPWLHCIKSLRVHLIHTSVGPLNQLNTLELHLIRISVGFVVPRIILALFPVGLVLIVGNRSYLLFVSFYFALIQLKCLRYPNTKNNNLKPANQIIEKQEKRSNQSFCELPFLILTVGNSWLPKRKVNVKFCLLVGKPALKPRCYEVAQSSVYGENTGSSLLFKFVGNNEGKPTDPTEKSFVSLHGWFSWFSLKVSMNQMQP